MTVDKPRTPGTTTATATGATAHAPTGERADLLQVLAQTRHFLRHTTRDLTDEQAGLSTTVSELSLGGLVKHVTDGERRWVDFVLGDPTAMRDVDAMTEADWTRRTDSFRMLPGETLAGVLAAYEEVAARTDSLIPTLDLDATRPLPKAPWFEPGASWSARQVLLHVIHETAQHAGHADIIREALDGAKSMG